MSLTTAQTLLSIVGGIWIHLFCEENTWLENGSVCLCFLWLKISSHPIQLHWTKTTNQYNYFNSMKLVEARIFILPFCALVMVTFFCSIIFRTRVAFHCCDFLNYLQRILWAFPLLACLTGLESAQLVHFSQKHQMTRQNTISNMNMLRAWSRNSALSVIWLGF